MKRNCYEVVTVAEMKEAERHTCEVYGVTATELMERAGAKVFRFLNDKRLIERDKPIYVICGPGNNGGDGLVLARHLFANDYQTRIILMAPPGKMTKAAEASYRRLGEAAAGNVVIVNEENVSAVKSEISKAYYIVDAIFGTGLDRPVDGLYTEMIDAINESAATVFSIDIPSGINGDNGLVMGTAVKAAYTLVIQYYKPGNLLNDSCDFSGSQIVLSIGIVKPESLPVRPLLSTARLASHIRPRRKNSHKYYHGKVVIFGGSRLMPGAPLMAAEAALRSGTGIAVVAVNGKYRRYVNPRIPEIIVEDYRPGRPDKALEKATTIAFGMGLGRSNAGNYRTLRRLLALPVPLVIDADGLFYLKKLLNLTQENIVITPHYGEFARLFGLTVTDVVSNPLAALENVARSYPFWIVLKGPTTMIAGGGATRFYRRPNSGMATAGSGDVLTGIIASFLAQGYMAEEACELGVALHSLAGHAARKTYGEHGMIASDIITQLPAEILKLMLDSGKL